MTDGMQIKQLLLGEIDALAKDLANGGGSDLAKQGQALSYILRILRPIVERESVQESECKERMGALSKKFDDHAAGCPAIRVFSHPAESGGVILANLAKTSLPWLLLIGGLALWGWMK